MGRAYYRNTAKWLNIFCNIDKITISAAISHAIECNINVVIIVIFYIWPCCKLSSTFLQCLFKVVLLMQFIPLHLFCHRVIDCCLFHFCWLFVLSSTLKSLSHYIFKTPQVADLIEKAREVSSVSFIFLCQDTVTDSDWL